MQRSRSNSKKRGKNDKDGDQVFEVDIESIHMVAVKGRCQVIYDTDLVDIDRLKMTFKHVISDIEVCKYAMKKWRLDSHTHMQSELSNIIDSVKTYTI